MNHIIFHNFSFSRAKSGTRAVVHHHCYIIQYINMVSIHYLMIVNNYTQLHKVNLL